MKELSITPSENLTKFQKYIDHYVNTLHDCMGIPFPMLVKEMQDYAHKLVLENPPPPYNTDEYWDWRCEQAKSELHKTIDSKFAFDRLWTTFRYLGIILS